jgi:uncharacterized membrane protein SirB2
MAMANDTQELDPATAAFTLSAAITVLFNTVLTWIKELSEPFHDFLAALTGHHWITHGIIDIVVFIALGFVFMRTGTGSRMTAGSLIGTLVVAVVIAGIGLAGFFLVA